MKIKKLFIFLFLIVIFPSTVLAYDISCDNGKYKYNDSFKCYINGIEENKNYESLSGNFTIPDTLDCSIEKAKCGFEGDLSGTSFNFSGTTCGKDDFVLACKVKKEISEDTTAQITIDNFKYKLDGNESSEKLRSNLINLIKTPETTTTTTSKNRNILNGNSLLKNVEADIEFTFSKYITEYDIQVLYSVKEVNFTYEKNLDSARVTLAASDSVTMEGNKVNVLLEEVGTKSFDLIVRSDDGGETVYTFNVQRLDKGEGLYDKNTDASLSSLQVGNYNINFNPKNLNYSITVDSSVETLAVSATPTVDGATVSVENNTNIQNGTKIFIKVTALDKHTTQTYVVSVKKNADQTLIINSIIIGGGALLILILILRLIKVMNHKSKDDPIYKYKMEQKSKRGKSESVESVVPQQVSPQQVENNSVNNTTNNQSNLQ